MGDYWKPTAEMFTSLIKRPKMEEKNLTRPPFKFILAVYQETVKETGFAQGLFSNEDLNGEFDRNKKIDFLTKMIKVVTVALGEECPAKVNMIIAGKECEATNTLLQMLYKCATTIKDSTKYVNQVLGKAEPEPPKEEPKREPKKKEREPSPKRRENTPPREEPPKKKSPSPERNRRPSPKNAKNEDEGGYYANQVKAQVERENIKDDDTTLKSELGGKKGISMKLRNRNKRENASVAGTAGIPQEEVKNQDLTDIDGLKGLIQSITQATNPLGKIVEMIDDDLESMGKEYDNWTRVYNQSKEKMKDREKEIEGDLQTLYDKITSKDEQIKEKKAQIEAIKTQQMRNAKKIEKLQNDIVGSK